jgi:hypothetical protein
MQKSPYLSQRILQTRLTLVGMLISKLNCLGPHCCLRYSDVLHEVCEVTSGHRFVLTYNLVVDPLEPRPSVSSKSNVENELANIFDTWQESLFTNPGESFSRIIYKLDHQYTKTSLKIKSLKGRDLEIVNTLTEVCDAKGFMLFLAGFEREVDGSPEENFDYDSEFDSPPGPEYR